MSEYTQKRIDYVNNWPNVDFFPAEIKYKKRCNNFTEIYDKQPLNLLTLWNIDDNTSNRLISHLVETLDMMPLHPNWAFTFLFTGLDYYCDKLYTSNTTANLKSMANDLSNLCNSNADVMATMQAVFSAIPPSTCIYMYEQLYKDPGNTQVIKRITTESNNVLNSERKALLDAVYAKYGYDSTRYSESIRKASMLYRKIFIQNSIILDKSSVNVSVKTKLHLLVSGILYTLRNDSAHGSSMATTKSSLTNPERYASNYYCYLALYTLLMLLLIKNSTLTDDKKSEKYNELKSVTKENIEDFKKLFGNHVK